MNIPDDKPFNELPTIIQFLAAASNLNQPVGSWAFEKGIKEHPEYFLEEIEHRRKWDLVPQEVKDAYFKELSGREWKLTEECRKFVDGDGGILYWLDHQKEWNEYNNCLSSKRDERARINREVHDKWLAQYGIKFIDRI